MAVLLNGANMMFLGLKADKYVKKDGTGEIVETLSVNLMDLETNDIHNLFVNMKNEVLKQQLQGLKMASICNVIFKLDYDKFAIMNKKSPTKFTLHEIYKA